MKFKQLILLVSVLSFLFCQCKENNAEKMDIHLIPQPAELTVYNGIFRLSQNGAICYTDEELASAANYMQQTVLKQTGISLKTSDVQQKNSIVLKTDASLGKNDKYILEINKDGVFLTGSNSRAIILGIQTVRQLMPFENVSGKGSISLPHLSIADQPAWEWRGMMMDVGRHFIDKEEVKDFLDLMTLYKFNKFHFHLSDDQGWRVEIKKYPLLTEKSGWRTFNNHDRGCLRFAEKEDNPDYKLPEKNLRQGKDTIEYGGFFTQDDIREIVAYATERGIDVIPEIDMPGHFSAAIKAYPELSCFDEAGWGKQFSAPMCPGKDATVEFCKNVYKEIFELFPYNYVHIGADEVEKDNWKKCPKCQARIKANNLKDEKELQSWFIKEMKHFFDDNNRKLIGWDEIIEGGLPEGATVMWWRNWAAKAVHKATEAGSEVILTPNSHYYFDFQQDDNTLRRVYDYDPVPEGLSDEQKKLIKGVQANLWAEWIPSYQRLQYMAFPRMLALSETAWCYNNKNWDCFYERIKTHFLWMDHLNVNYRPLDITGIHKVNVFVGSTKVEWKHPLPDITIYFTTDSSMPNLQSTRYEGPFDIDESTFFTLRFYRPDGTPAGTMETSYRKEEYAPGETPESLQAGLKCAWHEDIFRKCLDIENIPVKETYTVENIVIPEGVGGKRGLIYSGYLQIEKKDIYTFYLGSDDGSMLYIGDEVIVDNDGPHGPTTLSGQKALDTGYHPVKIHYFDMNNGGFVNLKLENSDGNPIELNKNVLFHQPAK